MYCKRSPRASNATRASPRSDVRRRVVDARAHRRSAFGAMNSASPLDIVPLRKSLFIQMCDVVLPEHRLFALLFLSLELSLLTPRV